MKFLTFWLLFHPCLYSKFNVFPELKSAWPFCEYWDSAVVIFLSDSDIAFIYSLLWFFPFRNCWTLYKIQISSRKKKHAYVWILYFNFSLVNWKTQSDYEGKCYCSSWQHVLVLGNWPAHDRDWPLLLPIVLILPYFYSFIICYLYYLFLPQMGNEANEHGVWGTASDHDRKTAWHHSHPRI